MLVLTRQKLEQIMIGDNITLTVVRIGMDSVKLGIEAPCEINIRRSELPAGVDEPKPGDSQ